MLGSSPGPVRAAGTRGEAATCTLIAIAHAAVPALAGFAAPKVSRVWGRIVRRAVGYSGSFRRESRSGRSQSWSETTRRAVGHGAADSGGALQRCLRGGRCARGVCGQLRRPRRGAWRRTGTSCGATTAGATAPCGGERAESGRGSHRVVSRETAIREAVCARVSWRNRGASELR